MQSSGTIIVCKLLTGTLTQMEGVVTTGAVLEMAEEIVLQAEVEEKEAVAGQVVSAFRRLGRSCSLGSSLGDVSMRVPGTGAILMTPLRTFAEELTVKELLEVTMSGRLAGRRGRPGFSVQIHLAIYRQRLDVQAVVHCHAPMATVLGLCNLPIPPVTVDTVPFTDLPRIPVPARLDRRWAEDVAARFGDRVPGALLLNEGIVTVGENLRQAVSRTLAVEETARILVTCDLLQRVPASLPPGAVNILREMRF